MITMFIIVTIILSLLFIIGIGIGIVAVSPILAVILCFPLIDIIVIKIYMTIKKNKKEKED